MTGAAAGRASVAQATEIGMHFGLAALVRRWGPASGPPLASAFPPGPAGKLCALADPRRSRIGALSHCISWRLRSMHKSGPRHWDETAAGTHRARKVRDWSSRSCALDSISSILTCGISFAQRSRIGRISPSLAAGRRTAMRVMPRSRLRFNTSKSSGSIDKSAVEQSDMAYPPIISRSFSASCSRR